MYNLDKKLKLKISSQILENLSEIDGVISTTLVGSFGNKQFSDIDTVVICKKLDKKIFKKCNDSCKNIVNLVNELKKKKLKIKINNTFGPLKFDNQKYLVIHLMIYDINSHIKHLINSPFTCFDWERSRLYKGLKLSEICSAVSIQLSDFLKSRRGMHDYLKDIKNNKISYRKYKWIADKFILEKKEKKLNKRDKLEFCYHIFNNSLNNFLKYKSQKNINSSLKHKISLLKEIDKEIVEEYLFIRRCKQRKIYETKIDLIKLTHKFIKNFIKFINIHSNQVQMFKFIRHEKTLMNDGSFLGIKRNPPIIIKKNKPKKEHHNIIIVSPLRRSFETARYFNFDKIIINKRLIEINYGNFEGKTFNNNDKEMNNLFLKMSTNIDKRFPGGESYKDVLLRIKIFLNEDITKLKENKILIITHNVVLRTIVGMYYELHHSLWHLIKINNMKGFKIYTMNNKYVIDIDRNFLFKIYKSNNKVINN